MSNQRYTPEFKDEAIRQVIDRGHSVAEVCERLGVSTHSLYKWINAVKPDKYEQHERDLLEAKREILNLCAELRRTEEERDILKNRPRASTAHQIETHSLLYSGFTPTSRTAWLRKIV